MHLLEAVLIAKMGKLDEIVAKKQVEMKTMGNKAKEEQEGFLLQLLRQVEKEVKEVEIASESSTSTAVYINSGNKYSLDLDWTLKAEEFVDRLMDQVIVPFAEDLYQGEIEEK